MKKPKLFTIDEGVYAEFKDTCKLLSSSMSGVVELMMQDFISENADLLSVANKHKEDKLKNKYYNQK